MKLQEGKEVLGTSGQLGKNLYCVLKIFFVFEYKYIMI